MKPGLQLRLGQSLTLTPQLRQAIRLLQLSSIELDTEINLALESNPLLEEVGDEPAELPDEPPAPAVDSAAPDQEVAPGADTDDSLYETEAFDWDDDFPRASASSGSGEDRELTIAEDPGLAEHLLWQLNLTPMSERDHAIALAIIDSIDDNGYLHESNAGIAAAVRPEIEAEDAEIDAVRHRIQHFDPVGVASRDLRECLLVQLHALSKDTDDHALALRIVEGQLENLARHGVDWVARQLEVAGDDVARAVVLIRSLDPRPGARFAGRAVEYVAPDAYAYRQRGRWDVRLGSGSTPRLGINRHYENLIGTAARSDATYLRGQLQEARWLIRSLETRADTLLKVSRAIVGRQTAFLDHGPEAMRPLVLREIAEEVGLHESTISRVTTRKYLHTPRGTFELKHFFSSSLATVDGGSASSTAIQAMIRRLIEAEDPRRPLSDARLVVELKAQGVTVARRTVAKYREAMNIPSSNERQRLS
jgi:RNA polymerase sigma-54 factor